jgi:hypothetical protein
MNAHCSWVAGNTVPFCLLNQNSTCSILHVHTTYPNDQLFLHQDSIYCNTNCSFLPPLDSLKISRTIQRLRCYQRPQLHTPSYCLRITHPAPPHPTPPCPTPPCPAHLRILLAIHPPSSPSPPLPSPSPPSPPWLPPARYCTPIRSAHGMATTCRQRFRKDQKCRNTSWGHVEGFRQ